MVKSTEDLREEQETNRFHTLISLFESFISQYDNIYHKSVYLNRELLYSVVKSHFDDIYRFKDYSGSEWADCHKQAAYTIKWIMRFRPIQLLPDVTIDKYLFYINSSFAIFCGFTFLDLKVSETITEQLFKHLLYTTQYRSLSGRQLATLMYVLEQNARNEKP